MFWFCIGWGSGMCVVVGLMLVVVVVYGFGDDGVG